MKQLSWLSEHGYQVLVDHLQDGIFVVEDGKLTYVNQRLADIFAYPADSLLGMPFIDLIADEDKAMVSERHRARLAGERVPETYDLHIITGQGKIICCSMNVGLTQSSTGATVAVGSLRDVTAREEAATRLQEAEAELSAIFEQLPDVFYRTDMNGIVTKMSPSVYDNLGYKPEEIVGTPLAQYYATPEDRQKVVNAILNGGGKATQVEAALRRKDGEVIWVSTSAYVRNGEDGKPVCIEGLARDISERKKMEDQLLTLSRMDVMTGACNRHYFMDSAEEIVKMSRRYKKNAAVMLADLDYFKGINDRYGHHAGDLALEAFARICRQEIREPDIFGRMGGEEFALMLPETALNEALVLAERIRKATAAAVVTLEGQVVSITVSIGVAQVIDEPRALDSALRRADLAMYKAKENGRNQVVASPAPR